MGDTISSRKRTRKALSLVNKIVWSYLKLWLFRKLYRESTFKKRLEATHRKNAVRVQKTIEDLRGLFIKVGQLISSLSHVLPEPYMEALESLQDHAPKTPLVAIQSIFESETKQSIQETFAEFDETPLASASIGQVHKAKLKDGRWVALKIQHEGIEELAKADLEIVARLTKRVSFFFKINGIEHIYGQIRQMIEEELDYRKEAESMQRIRENLSDEKGIIIPEVVEELSSKKILTTIFQEGTKITNTEQLDEWKIDRNELGKRLILVYAKMVLEHGFYHADPHPGNLMVNKQGDIILLDFGAVAVMNDVMRNEIPILVQAIVRKDTNKILESMRKIGFVGSDDASTEVAEKLINAFSSFLESEINITNMNFKDIQVDDIKGSSIDKLRKEIGIRELTKIVRVPKDWILLDRTLQLLIGTSHTVAPEMDPIAVVRPYIQKLLFTNGGIRTIIMDAIKKQLTSLLSLPGEISSFLDKANRGELKIKTENHSRIVYVGIQQLIFLTISLISFILYYMNQKPEMNSVFIGVSSVFGGLLLISLWKNRKK